MGGKEGAKAAADWAEPSENGLAGGPAFIRPREPEKTANETRSPRCLAPRIS